MDHSEYKSNDQKNMFLKGFQDKINKVYYIKMKKIICEY